MLSRNLNRIKKVNVRYISSKDININNAEEKYYVKYGKIKNAQELEKFKKEYLNTHWLAKYTDKIMEWPLAPFKIGFWWLDRDTEQGKFRWNCNGGTLNRLANIFYRSESLQSRGMIRFFMKRFEHRHTLELNKAEEQPRITPNSVFLFRDNSNLIQNRRIAERLALLLIISQAWNVPTAFAYFGIAYALHIYQKTYASSLSMVKRMDLIPETEQIHILKIGLFGFPRSVLVNIKDLVKISKEEDTLGNIN
jgi:hypothetical protein